MRLAVERAVARLQKLDGAALFLQRNAVIKLPQIEIQSRRARRDGLEHVRSRAVGVAGVQGREIHAVHRIRVAGAQDVFDIQSGVLRRFADGLHKARFAAPRPALDHPQKILRPPAELSVKRDKAGGRIAAQKIPCHRHEMPLLYSKNTGSVCSRAAGCACISARCEIRGAPVVGADAHLRR